MVEVRCRWYMMCLIQKKTKWVIRERKFRMGSSSSSGIKYKTYDHHATAYKAYSRTRAGGTASWVAPKDTAKRQADKTPKSTPRQSKWKERVDGCFCSCSGVLTNFMAHLSFVVTWRPKRSRKRVKGDVINLRESVQIDVHSESEKSLNQKTKCRRKWVVLLISPHWNARWSVMMINMLNAFSHLNRHYFPTVAWFWMNEWNMDVIKKSLLSKFGGQLLKQAIWICASGVRLGICICLSKLTTEDSEAKLQTYPRRFLRKLHFQSFWLAGIACLPLNPSLLYLCVVSMMFFLYSVSVMMMWLL